MHLKRLFHHLRARPALFSGLGTALGATVAAAFALRFSQAFLVGWCSGAVVYLTMAWRSAARWTSVALRRRAQVFDQGSGFIFAVTAGGAIASISAIVLDLGHAKESGGWVVILLSGLTLVLSWFFVHTVFAFHYAHLYYLEPKALVFPGTTEPDAWDFIYFAMVIGMTAQVSDVTTGLPAVRRLVLVHSVIAFFFNTAILALGVNLAAGAVG